MVKIDPIEWEKMEYLYYIFH